MLCNVLYWCGKISPHDLIEQEILNPSVPGEMMEIHKTLRHILSSPAFLHFPQIQTTELNSSVVWKTTVFSVTLKFYNARHILYVIYLLYTKYHVLYSLSTDVLTANIYVTGILVSIEYRYTYEEYYYVYV